MTKNTKERGKTVELDLNDMKFLKILSAKLDVSIKELSSEAVELLKKKYKNK